MTEDTTGTAVALTKEQAIAAYGEFAGAGFENFTREDYKLPFIRLLQGLSPQVESVDGAKAGMFCNSVTNALFPAVGPDAPGVIFVPAIEEHIFVEYERAPDGQRLPGGDGFRGIHKPNSTVVVTALKELGDDKFVRDDAGKVIQPKSPDGHDLIETKVWQGIQFIPDSGNFLQAVFSFSSTALEASRQWATMARNEIIPGVNKQYPLFAHVYRIGAQKKTKGANSWYVPTISFARGSAAESRLKPDDHIFKAAVEMYNDYKSGKSKVDYAQSAAAGEGGKKGTDEEIPF
jgi:hypothetical protein